MSLPTTRLDPNRGALEDPRLSVGNPGVALPGRLNRDLAAGWLTPPPQIPLQKPRPPPMRVRLTVAGNPKLAVALKLDLAGIATCSKSNILWLRITLSWPAGICRLGSLGANWSFNSNFCSRDLCPPHSPHPLLRCHPLSGTRTPRQLKIPELCPLDLALRRSSKILPRTRVPFWLANHMRFRTQSIATTPSFIQLLTPPSLAIPHSF